MRSILTAALLGLSCSAGAATHTVTTLGDSGPGSLRAAIAAANAAPGADTIRFQNGLTGTITLSSGEIRIADPLAIEGPGADHITVDGNASNRIFLLQRSSGARMTVTLSGLSLRRGRAPDGGAIYAQDENLVLRRMEFIGNAAATRGGALWLAEGDLTIEDSVLMGNSGDAGGQGAGGAVLFSAGTIRIVRSFFAENSANFGGAAYISSPRVNAVIEDSLFLDNEANHTGGAMVAGTMTSFRVARSAFVGNVAGQPLGGAIAYTGTTDAGAPAGVIENTTFSDNQSLHPAGLAGALSLSAGTLYLRNSTVADNRTAAAHAPIGSGGAVHVPTVNATLHVESTLFSNNRHGNTDQLVDLSHPADTSSAASMVHVSDSILHSTPGVDVINGADLRNQFATDALLQPLTFDEGNGFVPVHPIPLNSPAIDTGANPANLATDQRGPGFARVMDATPCQRPFAHHADVGAYEYRSDTIFCYGFEN